MSIYDVSQEEVDDLLSMFNKVIDEEAPAPKTAPPEPDYRVTETFTNKRNTYRNTYRNTEFPYVSPVIKSEDIIVNPSKNQKGLSNKTVVYSLEKYRETFD
jgi:hypothetical protein